MFSWLTLPIAWYLPGLRMIHKLLLFLSTHAQHASVHRTQAHLYTRTHTHVRVHACACIHIIHVHAHIHTLLLYTHTCTIYSRSKHAHMYIFHRCGERGGVFHLAAEVYCEGKHTHNLLMAI